MQLGVFEELAVLGDPDRAVLVADRLPAPRQVDDREPPRPQRDARLDVNLLVVRPSVSDRGGHRQQPRRGKFAPTSQIDRPSDSAHQADLSTKPRSSRVPRDGRSRRKTPKRPSTIPRSATRSRAPTTLEPSTHRPNSFSGKMLCCNERYPQGPASGDGPVCLNGRFDRARRVTGGRVKVDTEAAGAALAFGGFRKQITQPIQPPFPHRTPIGDPLLKNRKPSRIEAAGAYPPGSSPNHAGCS